MIAAAMLRTAMTDELVDLTEIGLAAADCVARSVARAIYQATALAFAGALPAWRDKFAGAERP